MYKEICLLGKQAVSPNMHFNADGKSSLPPFKCVVMPTGALTCFLREEMEIRELTKNDLPSLLELYIQLSENNKNITLEKSKEIWIKQIQENPNIKYFGAVENEKVVSTCYCVIIPNLTNFCQPICFVENVVTDKNHRNQGLGKKVIDKAIETAKKHNCYKVILLSGIARKEAHQFYENLGFSSETKKAFDMRI